jgi:hypothetical protein
MVGTQQAKPAKCAAANFRINRIAKPTSGRNKPILTHTTKGRLRILGAYAAYYNESIGTTRSRASFFHEQISAFGLR